VISVLVPAARGRLHLARGDGPRALACFEACLAMLHPDVWGIGVREAGYLHARSGAGAGAPADLFTPPWPLQAPRPPLDEVPSLQVTVPPPLLVPAGAAADAAAGAAAGAAVVAAPEADLLMPPCPLQAPRPPCGEVLPSLQVTGPAVSCAEAMTGSASSVAASTAPHIEALQVITFMAGSPRK
jgi:hypothetical protein